MQAYADEDCMDTNNVTFSPKLSSRMYSNLFNIRKLLKNCVLT